MEWVDFAAGLVFLDPMEDRRTRGGRC